MLRAKVRHQHVRTGAAAAHDGYFHEALLYESDDHFVDVVLHFLEEGLAAGEPAIVSVTEGRSDLLRSALTDPDAVTFLPIEDPRPNPVATIQAMKRVFDGRSTGPSSSASTRTATARRSSPPWPASPRRSAPT